MLNDKLDKMTANEITDFVIEKLDLLEAANLSNPKELLPLGIDVYGIQETVEALDKLSKKLKSILSSKTIPNLFHKMEVDSMNFRGKRIKVTRRSYASMLDESKAHEWIRKIGQGNKIKPNINHQTFSSIVLNYIEENGKQPPEDIAKIGEFCFTTIK